MSLPFSASICCALILTGKQHSCRSVMWVENWTATQNHHRRHFSRFGESKAAKRVKGVFRPDASALLPPLPALTRPVWKNVGQAQRTAGAFSPIDVLKGGKGGEAGKPDTRRHPWLGPTLPSLQATGNAGAPNLHRRYPSHPGRPRMPRDAKLLRTPCTVPTTLGQPHRNQEQEGNGPSPSRTRRM